MVIIFSKQLLLGIFLALLVASPLGSSASANSAAKNHSEAIPVADIHEQTSLIKAEALGVPSTRFTQTDRHSMVQSADLGGGAGIRAARFGSIATNANHSAGRQNTGAEAGNSSASRFFLITGFALIAARIVVSRRLQKVKNLATATN